MHPLLSLLLLACATEAPPVEPAPKLAPLGAPMTIAATDDTALSHARSGAKELGKTLKERLTSVLGEQGPEAAMSACADEASAMTALASSHDLRVGRASLRKRNPNNGGPDWVAAWLAEAGERPAAGLEPKSEVVDTEKGRVARFLAPIAVEPMCLTCHGPAEGLDPGVQALLAKRYPHDAATGYAVGDLRGVVWSEAKVAAPKP